MKRRHGRSDASEDRYEPSGSPSQQVRARARPWRRRTRRATVVRCIGGTRARRSTRQESDYRRRVIVRLPLRGLISPSASPVAFDADGTRRTSRQKPSARRSCSRQRRVTVRYESLAYPVPSVKAGRKCTPLRRSKIHPPVVICWGRRAGVSRAGLGPGGPESAVSGCCWRVRALSEPRGGVVRASPRSPWVIGQAVSGVLAAGGRARSRSLRR
jgi:hypothetical protein